MRGRLLRLHRYLGLALAAYLIIAGLTGSVMAFDREIDRALNRDLLAVRPASRPLPIEQLVEQARSFAPGAQIVMLTLGDGPGDSVAIHVQPTALPGRAPFTAIYLDPGTGRVLGTRDAEKGNLSRRGLIRFLYVLHYSLHGGALVRMLLGFVALLWLADCFVGLYLTFPRSRPFLPKWWAAWRIKHPASGYRRTFDLHRAVGLWLWGVLATIAFTGAFLNLRTVLFMPLINTVSSSLPTPIDKPPPAFAPEMRDIGFPEALRRADQEASKLRLPAKASYAWYGKDWNIYEVGYSLFSPESVVSRIYVDGASGKVLQSRPFASAGVGEKLSALQLPVHSGRVAGLPGRILICATGVAVALLAVTGIAIWWKKRRAHRLRDPSKQDRSPALLSSAGTDHASAG